MTSDLYREQILDHYKNPHNFGELDDADVAQEGDNPLCGDVITLYLKLDDGKLSRATFRGRGCAISQASASMLTDMIVGKPIEELKHFPSQAVLDELGV
ncbi:MAG TPA: SUF system NifU family Fe-S cluster assembly protein, partial [Candidatus Eisenbacteria bacterium]|nr:SUF system NifU family Fe-S cluster assembly protein [Candidatus Eisenbacteria bacterium]